MSAVGEPLFPPELEREIFETTGLIYPRSIPTLLRVCRRSLMWIEPMRYRLIRSSNRGHAKIIERVKNSKPPSFFRGAVRHLALNRDLTEVEKMEVLSVCTGVVDLVLHEATPAMLPLLSAMRLQRLAVSLMCLFGRFTGVGPAPLFASVTHLHLSDWPLPCILAFLPTLPALTHLRFNVWLPWSDIAMLLRECKKLEVLAPFLRPSEVVAEDVVRDIRLVVVGYADYWDGVLYNKIGIPFFSAPAWCDFWECADAFVTKRRSGAVPGLNSVMADERNTN
ncbi:hypothetical protein GGX14DRAFT_538261 [Mycena pura]|uniref:Uncharacterized protein n=1 Tax=Mycena pura TaxID=153505 RepID=A0AAD6YUK1_9AGAR|nr:hypothetical protein GGX14DRAFT_538261 [Mycena pura]